MAFALYGRNGHLFLNREKFVMREKLGKSLMLLAILGCLPAGILRAYASGDSGQVSNDLTADFFVWVEALDAEMGTDSPWEFPFGAPRYSDLSSEESKIVLSLRRLARNEELGELESLVDVVERRQDETPVQMRFWLAYSQNLLHKEQSCLTNLKLLLSNPDGWRSLEVGQRAWVLTRTPDLLFVLENRDLAVELYTRLAASPVEQLYLWGKYQLAGMNFLNRDFEEASLMYGVICAADNPGPWKEHACAMADIAGRLTFLGKEETQYGAVATSSP